MSKFLTFLGAVSLAVVPLLVGFFLNLKEPDVRYTLSEAIPVSFLSGPGANENIQQIEVQNLGDAAAEEIVLKVSAKVTDFELDKNASTDSVAVDQQRTPFELIYQQIPPQGGFKLVLKSERAIRSSDLSVAHSGGAASEALGEERRSILGIVASILVLIFYFGMAGWALYSILISNIKVSARSLEPRKLVQKRRPWFLTEAAWSAVHRELLFDRMESKYFSDPEDNVAVWVLSSEKPGHFDEKEWREISTRAINNLKDIYGDLAGGFTERDVLKFYRLERPRGLPESDWEGLLLQAGERFVELRARYRGLRPKGPIVASLGRKKPDEVPEDVWLSLREKLQRELVKELVHEARTSERSPTDIDSEIAGILDQEHRLNLSRELEEIAEFRRDQQRSKEYSRTVSQLLEDSKLADEKPDAIDPLDWHLLKDLSSKFTTLNELDTWQQNLQKELAEFETEKRAFERVKAQVIRQLELISRVLNSPDSIDQIESYDTTFSPGNLENLRLSSRMCS